MKVIVLFGKKYNFKISKICSEILILLFKGPSIYELNREGG